MKYSVIDVETSVKNVGDEAIGKNKASPYHKDNRMVAYGWLTNNIESTSLGTPQTEYYLAERKPIHVNYTRPDLLVGHNIAFDLHYLKNSFVDDKTYNQYISSTSIWDTMIAEYLLTGQESKFASLDKLSEKYGGTLKDDRIKEFWDSGVDTEDIPKEMLLEYLEHDLKNTEIVFRAQLEEAHRQHKLDLIVTQMDARLATTAMEYAGMHFDTESCAEKEDTLLIELHKLEADLVSFIGTKLSYLELPDININSPVQLSAALFGGSYEYTIEECILNVGGSPVQFKSGRRKGQTKTKRVKHKAYVSDPLVRGSLHGITKETKRPGVYATNDSVLDEIMKVYPLGTEPHFIAQEIKFYRGLKKDISTYYKGYRSLIWPDGLIHPQFNHCSTDTGRLSSSNPNFQNVSNKKD